MYTREAAVRLMPTPPALRLTRMRSGDWGAGDWNSRMVRSRPSALVDPVRRHTLNPAA